ncbi:hypothetical protein CYMTET_8046 [Cymbomonas tetramitiformis]|uniref:Galactose oxidase n=1 Tax=Cymbomonas tetramitiformis TaxID=36881 RepID=A0AAE0LGV4_9CHLO|nr:hypothetical protein CYMTET_11575 [Cymbomonas tetramitiformis]KAK3284299.1 hypothetical protein CYMTET_8046 [Cymbomonas tetramitiformis]
MAACYFAPYFNDMWCTNNDGATWTLVNKHTGFSARSGNLLLAVGGALFTFGGYGPVPMKHDAHCLRPGNLTGEWLRLPNAPWSGRFDYDMVVANGSIVLLGGEASLFGAGEPYFHDVWEYPTPSCAEPEAAG